MSTEIQLSDLDGLLKSDAVLLLAHDGKIDKKVNKAFSKIENGAFNTATLDFSQDETAIEKLEIAERAPTLLVFEQGEEIGRIFRPKAKDVYDYGRYLRGESLKPEDRTQDDKPAIGGNAPAKPIHVTSKTFKSVVLKSKEPILVDLWAPWCGPCNVIAPVIEKLAGVYDGQAKFAKVNIDENQKIAKQYGVMSIPTMIIFKDGKEVDRLVGAVPEIQIRSRIERWV